MTDFGFDKLCLLFYNPFYKNFTCGDPLLYSKYSKTVRSEFPLLRVCGSCDDDVGRRLFSSVILRDISTFTILIVVNFVGLGSIHCYLLFSF